MPLARSKIYAYRMAEWTAMFRPSTVPVSDLETALVMAAVTIALIRHNEQVNGNKSIKKSQTWLINVWKNDIISKLRMVEREREKIAYQNEVGTH